MAHRMLSPQPPHLKFPLGGSFGWAEQEQLNKPPEAHALLIVYATDAELRAYTKACSLVPKAGKTSLTTFYFKDLDVKYAYLS